MTEAEEVFKSLEHPFDGYKISNFGRILSPKGKECKPYIKVEKKNGKTYTYPYLHINIRRKNIQARLLRSLADAVYEAFCGKYVKGAIVYHKDGNHMNCRIDNLFISTGYTQAPTEEQISKYEKEAKACILHFIFYQKYNKIKGFDVDNVIGDAYLLIWKHLSQYKTGTSFYSFCTRYTEWAFLCEYKKYKNRIEHCLSYEQLQENRNEISF